MIMAWLRRILGREDAPAPTNGHVEALEREQARLVARLEALQIRVDLPRGEGADERREGGKRGAVSR